MTKKITTLGLLVFVIIASLSSCQPGNQAPIIHSMMFNPNTSSSNRIPAGTIINLSVVASDPDQDPYTYSWSANGGEFTTDIDTRTAKWKAPAYTADRDYTITISVSDGQLTTSKAITMHVEKISFGTLEGHVVFTNTYITIPDVLVTISDQTAVSDKQGYFHIQENILTGTYTLTAEKEGFTSHVRPIDLQTGLNTYKISMNSSIYTSSIYGYVTTAENDTPVAFCEVVVLNPDGTESNIEVIASHEGYYQMRFVPQGSRTIRFTHEAYETLETTITLESENYELNVSLQ